MAAFVALSGSTPLSARAETPKTVPATTVAHPTAAAARSEIRLVSKNRPFASRVPWKGHAMDSAPGSQALF
ncbi:hypothetical protein [Nocardiopsis sp. CNT-189]|uniref:hypothetical protein n=1 Tax=Nocardiopsis oceanisediminis TaxID=2816862 RepID=UPI003B3BA5C0